MTFNTKAIEIDKTCKTFTVNLGHSGSLPKNVMGHNWVLSKTADAQPIATDGMGAGIDKQYLKEGDARVIAATKIIGAGEKDSVTFDVSKLEAGQDYTFFCSFPGHIAMMKGAVTLK
jgi:azurin